MRAIEAAVRSKRRSQSESSPGFRHVVRNAHRRPPGKVCHNSRRGGRDDAFPRHLQGLDATARAYKIGTHRLWHACSAYFPPKRPVWGHGVCRPSRTSRSPLPHSNLTSLLIRYRRSVVFPHTSSDINRAFPTQTIYHGFSCLHIPAGPAGQHGDVPRAARSGQFHKPLNIVPPGTTWQLGCNTYAQELQAAIENAVA